MELILKRCGTEDIAALRELSVRTYFETFAHMNTKEDMEAYLSAAFDEQKLRGELKNSDSEFYFLCADGSIAGYLKVNEAPSQTDINDGNSLEIERIYVSSEFQGAGLGRYLMEKAIEMAISRRKRYLWLGVWEKNELAIRFYERNGFYKIGTHSFFMGEDEQTDHVMRKDLE